MKMKSNGLSPIRIGEMPDLHWLLLLMMLAYTQLFSQNYFFSQGVDTGYRRDYLKWAYPRRQARLPYIRRYGTPAIASNDASSQAGESPLEKTCNRLSYSPDISDRLNLSYGHQRF